MMNALSFATFIGFVVLMIGASVSRATGARSWVNRLIAYVVFCSLFAGFAHVELWPFSRWNIFSERLTQPVSEVRIFALDAEGREYEVDRRAFEPFTNLDLYTFLDNRIGSMSLQERQDVGSYLLSQLNRARERALVGRRIGSFDRYLGPFTAPTHLIYAPVWNDPQRVPKAAFAGLRIYRVHWDVFRLRDGSGSVERELRFQFPEGGR